MEKKEIVTESSPQSNLNSLMENTLEEDQNFIFFLSKLSTIYILTNWTIKYIYIYIYIYIVSTDTCFLLLTTHQCDSG